MGFHDLVIALLSIVAPADPPSAVPVAPPPPAAAEKDAPALKPAEPTKGATVVVKDAKLDAVVDAVQKAYDGTTDFSGKFTQKYTFTLLRRTQESKGTLSFKKPGLMRWDYTEPQPKAFVVDGKALWMYQPVDKNAFVNACFQQNDDLVAPIAFMWGAGKLRDQFTVTWFDGTFGDKTDHHLELTPKVKSAAYAKLILVVDPKTSRVKQSIVVDPSGNVNQFIFADVKFNTKLKDAAYAFTPPAGTHVARMPGSCEAPVPGLN